MKFAKAYWLASLTCLLSWLGIAQAAGVTTPPYQRVVLNNGVTLLLMERHEVPLVSFQAVVRGGALGDAPQRDGTASLVADLLMKGAGKRDAAQFAEAIESVGGAINSSAGIETLNVQGQFLSRDQSLMIELLADLLQRPHLAKDEFETLRKRQIEFLRAAKDSSLNSLVSMYAAAALFDGHPYGRAVSGSETTLAQLHHDDVLAFYRQQVGSDRLILAVTGDFNTATMLRHLRSAFTGWHRAIASLPSVTPAQHLQGRRVLLVDAPQAVQSYFWIGNLGIARTAPQRVALDVTNAVYGDRFSSLLNAELRVRTGLTYGAKSRFSRPSQPGSWSITSFTRSASTIEALDLALETLQRLHDQGLSEEQIRSGKNYLLGQFPTEYETAAQWADALTDMELYRLPHDEIDRYAARIEAVTSAEVRKVIADFYPQPDNVLLVVIGNAATLREALRKYGSVTEMKLSDPGFSSRESVR